MPVNPTPPTPPAGDDSNEPRKPRGPIDSHTMDQLTRDKEIIDATIDAMNSDPTLATDLAGHFCDSRNSIAITPANVQTLSGQAAAALQAGGAPVSSSAT